VFIETEPGKGLWRGQRGIRGRRTTVNPASMAFMEAIVIVAPTIDRAIQAVNRAPVRLLLLWWPLQMSTRGIWYKGQKEKQPVTVPRADSGSNLVGGELWDGLNFVGLRSG